MTDLIFLMNSLVKPNGEILIPGINDQVAPLEEKESVLYKDLAFSMTELHDAIGSTTALFPDEKNTLMHRWRYPSLSLHGIEGAFSAPGAKTVIPAKVIGKFSIRTVPNMEPADLSKLVNSYLDTSFKSLNTKNTLKVEELHSGKWWVASPDHWNYRAAAKAVEEVFGVKPDLTREGGSIPVTLTFQDCLGKNVLLLPMGRGDDGAHSTNEKLDLSNYISGIKLLGSYLHQIATIQE
jgi:Cys-Gly metallodipeptidase DUG1